MKILLSYVLLKLWMLMIIYIINIVNMYIYITFVIDINIKKY